MTDYERIKNEMETIVSKKKSTIIKNTSYSNKNYKTTNYLSLFKTIIKKIKIFFNGHLYR
ncbi:hypothetical protein H3N56_10660 [Cetobacterium sp. 2A]|uniref:hypothetical protein n=1 Tax=Cetobacterium sp. 2A TaxID=2754723 RepID=UPI00163BF800|nr:hypothetical protein [Cetobacterium sp. 2A]MBC2856900.1 hypothetical protein [Cetobacterium sp. 2A]